MGGRTMFNMSCLYPINYIAQGRDLDKTIFLVHLIEEDMFDKQFKFGDSGQAIANLATATVPIRNQSCLGMKKLRK